MSDTLPPPPPAPNPHPTEPMWAKTSISIYAMSIFLVALGIAYWSKDSSSLTMMMGAVISMATSVTNYWLGSSSGSSKKDDVIAASQPVKPGVTP